MSRGNKKKKLLKKIQEHFFSPLEVCICSTDSEAQFDKRRLAEGSPEGWAPTDAKVITEIEESEKKKKPPKGKGVNCVV